MYKVNLPVVGIFQEMLSTKDYAKVLEVLQPFLNEGDRDAQCLLANLYQFGWGVPENAKLAAEWYEKAAIQGNCLASNNLSTLYIVGGTGIEPDKKLAHFWGEKAREQGFDLLPPKEC